ncbi:nicotinamide-nucleotide adenylyltransferase [Candidatus Acetothermia bacterium]|nr:nicotinamide-nucleotide adenylyltransferase [Candidatus Acetothermia bacterium]MBI3461269.1 nicotinamide-nucleotide adenylyltransferase [Candidatus Acetothermia bacterium]MBI3660581.1 nicotinamide-nucleotide adenylyltransferase [Candidatus Acetothermia bacterium]
MSTNVCRALFLGRFQPYHNGHQALIDHIVQSDDVDELVIAVGSAQWSHTLRDPFTAGERIMMITKALAGTKMTTYVLPIEDIERNSLYVAHIRSLTPPFEIVYSNNTLVQELFSEAGFEVRPLPFVQRDRYEGTKIRELMLQGEEWKKFVPTTVAAVLDEIDGIERLRQIAKTDKQP